MQVTANSDEKTIRSALSGGCNDFITKPFRLAELQARLGLQETVMRYYSREVESRKQERILNAILPPTVIERLGSGQTLIADELERVTVMFADIVGFTSMAASHNTPKIIQMLDSLFCKFDALCDDHGVMKVETIGKSFLPITRCCFLLPFLPSPGRRRPPDAALLVQVTATWSWLAMTRQARKTRPSVF